MKQISRKGQALTVGEGHVAPAPVERALVPFLPMVKIVREGRVPVEMTVRFVGMVGRLKDEIGPVPEAEELMVKLLEDEGIPVPNDRLVEEKVKRGAVPVEKVPVRLRTLVAREPVPEMEETLVNGGAPVKTDAMLLTGPIDSGAVPEGVVTLERVVLLPMVERPPLGVTDESGAVPNEVSVAMVELPNGPLPIGTDGKLLVTVAPDTGPVPEISGAVPVALLTELFP